MDSKTLFWLKGKPPLAEPLKRSFFEKWAPLALLNKEEDGWLPLDSRAEAEAAIRVCGSCSSAFDIAAYLEEEGLFNEWDSVLALEQSQGVGQYGRNWLSEEGNLHLVWKLPLSFTSRQSLLSCILAYSLALSIRELGPEIYIKWPNDLILNDKKVGGILLRSSAENLFAGIGINLNSSPEPFYIRNAYIRATSLYEEGFYFSFYKFWERIFKKTHRLLSFLVEKDSSHDLVSDLSEILWKKGSSFIFYPPSIKKGEEDKVFSGILLGLAEDGGLRFLSGSEEKILYSGSIGPL